MRFSRLFTVSSIGLNASIITVETDVVRGLYHFSIVGLPDKSIEESKERICSAIRNSGYDSPKTKHHKITSALLPAHAKKVGSSFDLPIALSYLEAISVVDLSHDKNQSLFIGELSLDGSVRTVKGLLQMLLYAVKNKFEQIFIPIGNVDEAKIISRKYPFIKIYTPRTLADVIDHFKNKKVLNPLSAGKVKGDTKSTTEQNKEGAEGIDFADIIGQQTAKRAAVIAVAGGHNLLLLGPPGTGKTLIAKACANIIPSPSEEESLEIASMQLLTSPEKFSFNKRPFRSPHHTSSYTAMIGGGPELQPGEVSLAHKGILFLDEFPEFDRRVIESLREPLEEGIIKIARANARQTFPAEILLIAAANPCPCGFRGAGNNIHCNCEAAAIQRYKKKISGPILDRIDLVVQISITKGVHKKENRESTSEIREQINRVRKIQKLRSETFNFKGDINAKIPFENIIEITNPDKAALRILNEGTERLSLSMRGQHRILRVARTIADLDGSEKIRAPHMLEALSFRVKDI